MKKFPLILVVVLLLPALISPISTIARSNSLQASQNLQINMLECSPRYKDENPVMVAGFYHKMEFDSSQKPHIKLSYQNTSYHWWYDGGWKGDVSYMDLKKSKISGDHYEVVVGVNATDPYGTWNLQINAQEYDVYVEKPRRVSAEIQSADFYFLFEPFTSEKQSSSPQKYILENVGNSVLSYDTNFKTFPSHISVSKSKGIITPGQEIESDLTVESSEDWGPGYINLQGSVAVFPQHIVSNNTYALVPELKFSLSGRIAVGHRNYEIKDMGDGLTLQYRETITMEYQGERTLSFYLSGNETVTIDILSENIKIESVEGNEEKDPPYSVTLKPGREYRFTVSVKANIEDVTGKVVYKVNDETSTHRYRTTINVKRAPPGMDTGVDDSGESTSKLVNIGVIAVGLSFVSVYLFSRSKNGGEDER